MKILDHGYVRLVDHMGSDLSVVRSARVSYQGDIEKETPEKTQKLIHYLMKNRHTSPFESVTFTFEVKAPLFVLRQWHRHRTWSYNEVSARYTELPDDFYVPDKIGVQSKDNKQMRVDAPNEAAEQLRANMRLHHIHSFNLYQELLNSGMPRELARTVLPVAVYSQMFATVNLHNLFHFLRLRLHEHAQYEIQVYARAILDIIRDIVPISVEAFELP